MLEVEYFPAPLSDYATRNLAANPTIQWADGIRRQR